MAKRGTVILSTQYTSRMQNAPLRPASPSRGWDAPPPPLQTVEAVLDKSNATANYTEATELAASSFPVRVDYRYAIMHDKFIVVDGVTVETGSFNLTSAAEKPNAENVIMLREYPDVRVNTRLIGRS
jgi:phosphatidylserine/phosphatidylglycerophosphate/cardiolipin synthase-like enzyme